MGFWSRMRFGLCGAALLGAMGLAAAPATAAGKFKVFLSMSYIGNDWQAEAANMVKAMAAHGLDHVRSLRLPVIADIAH